MFMIRRAQLQALEHSVQNYNEKRILGLLQEHFLETPVWTSEATVSALVRAAIEKAESHGMRAARDAFKVAVLMMVFGPGFDRDEAWARRILAERSTDGEVADLLYLEGIARVREREMASLEARTPGKAATTAMFEEA